MIQIVVWTRDKDSLRVGPTAGRLVGVPRNQIEAMDFPADRFSPQLAGALRRAYEEEHESDGPTTWKLLSFPFLCIKGVGCVPAAVLLIFEREDGQWMKTIGHIFFLSPPWWFSLPECCQRAVAGLAEALLGNSAEVDIAA